MSREHLSEKNFKNVRSYNSTIMSENLKPEAAEEESHVQSSSGT